MSRRLIIILVAAALFFLIVSIYLNKIRAPKSFPFNTVYTIIDGSGLNSLALDLNAKQIIRSPFWFKAFAVLLGGTKGVRAGDYNLTEKENSLLLAKRISRGEFDLVPIKVTIPEGMSNKQIAVLLEKNLHKFDKERFMELAKDKEGYLFPDTYFFLPNQNPEIVVKTLADNFAKKINEISLEIAKFERSLSHIIIMASIIEEEGKEKEGREIISGILWKRLDRGMFLQVDAPFRYSIGKHSYNLTSEDLKTDDPYNTYTRKGLPPTPITNPGLESILAAIHPTSTAYYFFLSEKNGTMHYAINYDGHLQNKELYLQ